MVTVPSKKTWNTGCILTLNPEVFIDNLLTDVMTGIETWRVGSETLFGSPQGRRRVG